MKEVLVWVLVTIGTYKGAPTGQVVYSPPMSDMESCLRLQQAVEKSLRLGHVQCVQIRMVVSK